MRLPRKISINLKKMKTVGDSKCLGKHAMMSRKKAWKKMKLHIRNGPVH